MIKPIHTALITCGVCGEQMKIVLGVSHAIVCMGCKEEIVIGDEIDDDMCDCGYCEYCD